MQWGETTITPMTEEMRKEWDKVNWDKVPMMEDWAEEE